MFPLSPGPAKDHSRPRSRNRLAPNGDRVGKRKSWKETIWGSSSTYWLARKYWHQGCLAKTLPLFWSLSELSWTQKVRSTACSLSEQKTSTLSIFYDISTFAITFSNSEWRNFNGNYLQKYKFGNNYMHLILGIYFAKYVQRVKFSTCD